KTKVAGNIVSNGSVTFDYLAKNIDIEVKADSNGQVVDLLGFIEPATIKQMKNSNIDLTKLTGKIDTKIFIKIPLGRPDPNIYDITTNIIALKGNLLNDNIKLSSYSLKGKFD